MSEFGIPVGKEADSFTPTAPIVSTEITRPATVVPQSVGPGAGRPKTGSDSPAQYRLLAATPDIVVEQGEVPAPLIRNKVSSSEAARTQAPNSAGAPEPDQEVLARRLLDTLPQVKKTNSGLRSESAQLDEFVDLLHTSKDFRFHRPDGMVEVKKIPKSVLHDLRHFQLTRFGKAFYESPTSVGRRARVSRSHLQDPEPVLRALCDMVVQANLARRFTQIVATRRQELVSAAIERVTNLEKTGQFQQEMAKLNKAFTGQAVEPQKVLEAFLQGKQ